MRTQIIDLGQKRGMFSDKWCPFDWHETKKCLPLQCQKEINLNSKGFQRGKNKDCTGQQKVNEIRITECRKAN